MPTNSPSGPLATASDFDWEGALATMAATVRSAGFDAWPENGGVSSMFGIRGARGPTGQADALGAVCELRIVGDTATSAICCRATLVDRVPAARRLAVAEAAMQLNESTLFGSWDLDLDTGALSVRMWTHVEGGAVSDRVATGLLGAILQGSAESAAELCAIAFQDAHAAQDGQGGRAR